MRTLARQACLVAADAALSTAPTRSRRSLLPGTTAPTTTEEVTTTTTAQALSA